MKIGALLALLSVSAFALDPPKVSRITLANGMTLLVEEDHDIPSVALYLFFKVGSRNERPGITGISHFFEHMMFNGSKKYGPKMFDVVMEKNGGSNNAYTSNDLTVYTDWFPPSALETMMDMESDRIVNLSFDPKIIEGERGVVSSERQTSVDNSNFGLLYEQMNAAAFTAHPYSWPVVGWASDIKAWTLEDLRGHYKMGYAPNNCVAVVVGDVTVAQVQELAKKYLEPLARQEPPPPVRTVEPEQRGERRVEIRKPAQLPLQMIAYHVPETKNTDVTALDVLGVLLTRGRSSRLYSRMVDREGLALGVDYDLGPNLDPGLFTFMTRPRAGIATAQTEKALLEELDRVINQAPSAEELTKAKNQLLTSFYGELKTVAGRANQLGRHEVYFGNYERLYQTPSMIEAVTPEEIQRVAKKYFTPANRTVANLIPEAPANNPQPSAGAAQ